MGVIILELAIIYLFSDSGVNFYMNQISAYYLVQVALKLVPENNTFIRLLLAEEEECSILKEEIQTLVSLLLPILNEIHAILVIKP